MNATHIYVDESQLVRPFIRCACCDCLTAVPHVSPVNKRRFVCKRCFDLLSADIDAEAREHRRDTERPQGVQ